MCGKNTGAAPVAPAPVAAVVPRSDFCSTVDSDSCLQTSPGWDSLVTTYTCAGSTSWCTSWSKDMQRCCPFSCGSGELLEPECNLLPDQGTCIYPNAAQCPPTSAVVAPVAASAGCTYNPGSEYAIDGLPAGQFLHVMNIPAGTRDVTVRLAAPQDLDINLFTATDTNNAFMTYTDGHTFTSPKTTPGGTSVQLCADGCSTHARIPRTGSFPNGAVLNIEVTSDMGDELMYIEEVTEDIVLKVRSYALCDGVITVAWRGSASCLHQLPATWLGEVTEDMQTLLPDTVVAEAQEEAVAAAAEPTLAAGPPAIVPVTDAPTLSPTDSPTASPTGTCTGSVSSFIVLPAIAHV